MFEHIRRDFANHGRRFLNRAWWPLLAYRYGRWAAACRVPGVRWLASKAYGLISLATQILTGVELDRGVQLGDDFKLVHAGTIVIHPDVVFGDRCMVMHGVTVGTNMKSAAPRIGDDVFIGAGAAVLGGIRVGDGATIAANAVVTRDVPPGMVAIGAPATVRPRRHRAGAVPISSEYQDVLAGMLADVARELEATVEDHVSGVHEAATPTTPPPAGVS